MPGVHLLVSVRDAAEAVAARAGGADLIDVKEPSRGPLGRADVATIASAVQAVGGKIPFSVALGELRECPAAVPDSLPAAVRYVKWGLAGLSQERWDHRLRDARRSAVGRCAVVVAYADADRVDAPRAVD